jgi:hypothetical protein
MSAQNNIASLRKDGASTMDYLRYVGDEIAGIIRPFWSHLTTDCLTATLAMAYRRKDSVETLLVGDGVVGARGRDGHWVIKVHEPEQSGCFYLSYIIDEQVDAYFALGGEQRLTTFCGLLSEPFEREESTVVLTPNAPFFTETFPLDLYDFVFVGSDGLTSFFQKIATDTSKYTCPVPIQDVLRVLLDVPDFNKDFLRRQRHWAFKRKASTSFIGRDWHNGDDVSLGAIHCG